MMHQENYTSSPNGGESLQSEAKSLQSEAISQEIQAPSQPENSNQQQIPDHLKRRINTLTGVLVGAVLLMMGSLTWMTLQLQSQAKLVRQSDRVSEATEVLNRLTAVEQQLQTLSERAPEDLLTQVQTNQTQLETISSQLKQLGDNAQSLQNLTNAVRELAGPQIDGVTPAQSAPVQSPPAPSDIDSSAEDITL